MLKQTILATIAVFIAWSALDFVIHGLLLADTYQATAHLWRPEEEMKMPLMSLVTFIFASGFVGIYSYFINAKSMATAIKYGIVFGLTTGVSMGFGSYSYMPIPLDLAITWFIGNLVEVSIAGAIIGLIIKPVNSNL
ncbi:hypothetical protein A9Q79_07550 [Methylophaga sp. 42_25_T18]|nr:hypothetical protein A9Q79_07550 [Methylophaga sp. 42_25_T18]OUR87804.1 hypothetical protein A9Q92_03760 [Methylophaga sp. 42_8_T64]